MLYSGGSPASGKRLGSMPWSTCAANAQQDLCGDVGAAGRERQAGQRDHGVAAPIAEPVIAGDDGLAARRARR